MVASRYVNGLVQVDHPYTYSPVMALWAIAGPRLGQILTDALANVSGP